MACNHAEIEIVEKPQLEMSVEWNEDIRGLSFWIAKILLKEGHLECCVDVQSHHELPVLRQTEYQP